MRDDFQFQLDRLSDHRTLMASIAADAVRDAGTALQEGDEALARRVINTQSFLDDLRITGEQVAVDLLATQAPVAGDLRRVVSGVWIVASLHRMGALAVHIARVAERRAAANDPLPTTVLELFDRIGTVAADLADTAGSLLSGIALEPRSDVSQLAADLEASDDRMDRLHRQVFDLLFSPSWDHGVASAIDVALLGRYYERFGDQAVAVSRRVVYILTGANIGGDRTATFDATAALQF